MQDRRAGLWQDQERAGSVFDKVTITYRGAKYEIGRGQDFYGIWMTGAPRSQPLEWWPESPEGWSAAWTRFASIEAPGAIVPVGRRTPPVDVSAVRAGENPGPFGQNTAPPDETAKPAEETMVAAGGGTGRTVRVPARRRVGGQPEDGRHRRGGARRGRHPGGGRAFPGVSRRIQPRPACLPAHPACHLPRRLDRERRAHPPGRRPPAARCAARPGLERGHVRSVLRGRRHGHRRKREHGRRGARARPRRLARLRGGIGDGLPAPAWAGPGRAAGRTRTRWRDRTGPHLVPS